MATHKTTQKKAAQKKRAPTPAAPHRNQPVIAAQPNTPSAKTSTSRRKIPYPKMWWEMLIHPEEGMKLAEQYSTDNAITDGLRHVIWSSLVIGFIGSLILGPFFLLLGGISLFGTLLVPPSSVISSLVMLLVFWLVLSVFYTLLIIVFSIINQFIINGVVWVLARMLDGKGTFEKQFYFDSVLSAGYLTWGSLISMITFGFGLIVMIVVNLISLTKILKDVHAFDTTKAVLSWLLPVLFFIALYIGFLLLFNPPY
jgi:hypothetical protein